MDRKKIVAAFFLLILVLSSFFWRRYLQYSFANVKQSPNQISQNSETISENVITPSEPTSIASDNWITANWQSIEFSYPSGFSLLEGDFPENYYYLEYRVSDTQLLNMRIFGISAKPRDEDFTTVVNSTKADDEKSFPNYELEKEGFLTPNAHYRQFTFEIDGIKYRAYKVTKIHNDLVRHLNINSEVTIWDHNKQVFEKIIQNIK